MKTALLPVAMAGVMLILSCSKPETALETRDFAMGTYVTQRIYGANSQTAAVEAMQRIRALEKMHSFYLPESDISLLNNAAGKEKVRVNQETAFLLKQAVSYSSLSEGAFNIMVGPLVRRWKVTAESPDVPSSAEINSLLALIDYKDLRCNEAEGTAFLARKGQMADLGGIAKGFAGDEAIKIYKKNGIRSALIDIGGNICALGTNIDGKPWNVGIQDPRRKRGAYLGSIKLSDKAVSTSGAYERFFESGGKKYHHIIDPKTGYPSESDLISATIIADSSVETDALSTAVFILGAEKGMQLVKKFAGTEAVIIRADGRIQATAGLRGILSCTTEVTYR